MDSMFFQAVLDRPDDMTARLVYADWLDECGDPRGEFIRAQIELAGAVSQAPSGPNAERLRQRARLLLERHRREWNGPLHRMLAKTPLRDGVGRGRPIRGWSYGRGFVEHLRAEARAFGRTDVLWRLGPLRHVHLLEAEHWLEWFTASPHFRWLEWLTVIWRQSTPTERQIQAVADACQMADGPRFRLCGSFSLALPRWQALEPLQAAGRLVVMGRLPEAFRGPVV